ncbi:hypothetical protein [Roseibium litorale]|uniref:SMODS and SLOG-associating 2TM effector domain-containing protein n=1 Tax=Roseibium litorale TaxID=2803841 RepID=A0ABR9CII5_9HYPH|nr:hypothetical protein [Roseibium litorale]MBD8890097.1 hypothetical protein [Roseibium litorale]
MDHNFQIHPLDRIIFDKTKGYVVDNSAFLMAANGAGITVVASYVSSLSVSASYPAYSWSIILFLAGLVLAFLTHLTIWMQNWNIKNSEKRDSTTRFYYDLCDAVVKNNLEGELTEKQVRIFELLPKTIIKFQEKSLSNGFVERLDKFGSYCYILSGLLFLTASIVASSKFCSF